jgi:hypothetical protein
MQRVLSFAATTGAPDRFDNLYGMLGLVVGAGFIIIGLRAWRGHELRTPMPGLDLGEEVCAIPMGIGWFLIGTLAGVHFVFDPPGGSIPGVDHLLGWTGVAFLLLGTAWWFFCSFFGVPNRFRAPHLRDPEWVARREARRERRESDPR